MFDKKIILIGIGACFVTIFGLDLAYSNIWYQGHHNGLDPNIISLKNLTEKSELVIEGKVVNSTEIIRSPYSYYQYHTIYTKYNVLVIDTLKGEVNQTVIPVIVQSGRIEDNIPEYYAISLNNNDDAMWFLEYGKEEYDKNSYNLVSLRQGIFLLWDGKAKSSIYPSLYIDDLKKAILFE